MSALPPHHSHSRLGLPYSKAAVRADLGRQSRWPNSDMALSICSLQLRAVEVPSWAGMPSFACFSRRSSQVQFLAQFSSDIWTVLYRHRQFVKCVGSGIDNLNVRLFAGWEVVVFCPLLEGRNSIAAGLSILGEPGSERITAADTMRAPVRAADLPARDISRYAAKRL